MSGDDKPKLKRSKANLKKILEKKIEKFRRRSPNEERYGDLQGLKFQAEGNRSQNRLEESDVSVEY